MPTRLEKVEDALHELTVEVRVMAEQTAVMRRQYDVITSRLNEINERPAARWNTAISAGISAVVAGAVGWFVQQKSR